MWTTSRRSAALGLLAALFATTLVAGAPDGFRYEESEQRLFLRREGCGATAQPGRLTMFPGADGSDGCGTNGGIPLREVNYQLGSVDWVPYSTQEETPATTGMPVVIDASRDLNGIIRVESWTGTVGGAGESAADIRLTITRTDGGMVFFPTQTLTKLVTPETNGHDLAFTYDLPDSLHEVSVSTIQLEVAMHGANWNQHNLGLEGDSHFTVPTLILVEDPAT